MRNKIKVDEGGGEGGIKKRLGRIMGVAFWAGPSRIIRPIFYRIYPNIFFLL